MIALILFIIGAILLLITFLIIFLSRYDRFPYDFILMIVGAALFATGFSSLAFGSSNVNVQKYYELKTLAEHIDEMPETNQLDIKERVESWNNSLNVNNNIFFKFQIEDRSEYYIEINNI